MIQQMPFEAFELLTDIFNKCMELGYWPEQFKLACVVPIKKSGKPSNRVSSYRPVSLLSSFSKLFERLVLEKLNAFIEESNIIPASQYGFKKSHSATHQAVNLAAQIKTTIKNKKSIGMLAIDLQSAFDSVWHEGLSHKLRKIGVSKSLCKIIMSFCQDRRFFVKYKNCQSNTVTYNLGLPQGAVLSPALYNIYIYDLPKNKDANVLSFADDTVIVTQSKLTKTILNRTEKAFVQIYKYFTKWRLNLMLNGNETEYSNELKYLGVYFDNKFNFNFHTKYIRNKSVAALKQLYPLIKNNNVSQLNRKILCKSIIIIPTVLYGMAAWSDITATRKKQVKQKLCSVCRSVMQVEYRFPTCDLYDLLNIPDIIDQIDAAKILLYEKLSTSQIDELRSLANKINLAWPDAIDINR